MDEKRYDDFREVVHHFRLQERLPVHIIQKPSYSKAYVTLSAPLGSVHTRFRDKDGRSRSVPPGAAHFLEHKVFEKGGRDVSEDFSLEGADINAFTDHHRTTYLFHATDVLYTNVTRLCEMFFFPEFTSTGVQREQNVILEELASHKDDPYYTQYRGLMAAMYRHHPLKDDILGTEESIRSMDAESLYDIHKAFYKPEQAVMVIVGDIDAARLRDHLEKTVALPEKTDAGPLPFDTAEPDRVETERTTEELDIMIPSVLFGIKLPLSQSAPFAERLRRRIAYAILFDIVFGKTGDVHEELLDKGVINDSYGVDLVFGETYAHALIGTETEAFSAFEERILAELAGLLEKDIADEDFLRVKRQLYGGFIQSLDNLETLAHQYGEYIRHGVSYYDMLAIARSITKAEVLALRETIRREHVSRFIARPEKPGR